MKNYRNLWPAKATMLALVGAVVGAMSASAAVVTYSQGDLLVGFRASGGTGASTTFVYNVGSSVGFRDNGSQGLLANVGTQLSATYGNDWYTRTDVSWGVIGVRSNANPQFDTTVVSGDPVSTIYASRATTTAGTSTPWGTGTAFSRSAVVSSATDVVSFAHTGTQVTGTFSFQEAAADTGGRGAFVATSSVSDWADYTSGSTDFTIFTGGIEGTFGTGNAFAYLDLYRILSTTSGANPTGTLGRGSYETTFSINSSGQISASAIPEPSTYAALVGFAALAVVGFRRRSRSNA